MIEKRTMQRDLKPDELDLLQQILAGRSVPPLPGPDDGDQSGFALLCAHLASIRDILRYFAAGDFDKTIAVRGAFAGYLKTLQAHLKHLTWQVEQVAGGDFSQRVDFMGSFSVAFNSMVEQLKNSLEELKEREIRLLRLTEDLQEEILCRRQTERELHQSETRWNLAVECSQDGIWDIDLKTREAWYSDRLLEMFGYTKTGTAFKPNWSKIVHPENATEAVFLESLFSGKIPPQSFSVECQVHRHDGSDIWVRIRGMPVREEDNSKPTRMIGVVTDITLQKQTEKNLAYQAMHDNLTGLPNRYLLEDRLRQYVASASRNGDSFILVMLDLDDFKGVNDTWGHGAGDTLLIEFGKRIRDHLRNTDTVARIGGDEFVFIYTCARGHEDAASEQVFERLYRSFQVPVMLGDVAYMIHSSMGASYFPCHATELETLFERADEALYESKRKGKNTYTVWTPTGDEG